MNDPTHVYERPGRPAGITGIAIFLAVGAVIATVTFVALLLPDGPLELMWRLNPAARDGFRSMGAGALILMPLVAVCCAASAFGLSRRRLWGWRLALTLLSVNLVGDVGNAIVRGDVRTLIGLPIGGALIGYLLSARSRQWFGRPPT